MASVPFREIEDPAKLRRLLESVLLLESDLDLSVLLGHLVEEACSMVGARYGALGVLNESRTALAEFITFGIDKETEAAIGQRPTGKGVLGLLIEEPEPLRLRELTSHPRSYGFPPNHPPMTSFLGMPVICHEEVYGNLYLTDKVGWAEFTKDDEDLVRALALAAGIAIENARLHNRVRDIAIYNDRDRIARDLHDAVIQRLFAVGLSLQGITRSPGSEAIAPRLHRAIADIDDTIREIRSSIFELTSIQEESSNRANILATVKEVVPTIGFEPHVSFNGPIDSALGSEVLDPLLLTLRETLSNVARHAQATAVRVEVEVAESVCSLRVSDNGRGMGTSDTRGGGLGLTNIQRRAEKLRGELLIESNEGSPGTVICWRVPLPSP